MQQNDGKYFNNRPQTLGVGRNSSFSEDGHVAYQIKGDDACSNMVANVFTRRHHPPWGSVKSQKSTFPNMVMLHIKLNGTTNAAAW